jgi:stage II sporulation protein D
MNTNKNKLKEPSLKIGIMYEPCVTFVLNGDYVLKQNGLVFEGLQKVHYTNGKIHLNDKVLELKTLDFEPIKFDGSSFDLRNVTIGIKFHWERRENQRFKGSLQFIAENDKITAINVLPLEDYLVSVISSEMSATSSMELLKAHAVISRSWLLAQVIKGKKLVESKSKYQSIIDTKEEYIHWYDREDHANFDVCADDHCQRYQGITRQSSEWVTRAIEETRGIVLMNQGNVCDARFSKSCGGISETFENVWEPTSHPYLQSVVDNSESLKTSDIDLSNEESAQKWIRNSPEAFCNTRDKKVLTQVLNDYDQETMDFYRWRVVYSQEQLSELISRKTGRDFGSIVDMVPLQRGKSGRIIRLKIIGTNKTLTIGKELQIRKILSESHLYSSAFVVDRFDIVDGLPREFVLTGAGWGHGVGLCQIGAAVMGEKGYPYREILNHYFKEIELVQLYD